MSELPTIDWWGDGIKAYPDNDMMKSGAVPNQSLVVKEHQTLINHIADLGLDIVFIPFSQQLEDAKKYDFVFQVIINHVLYLILLLHLNPKINYLTY